MTIGAVQALIAARALHEDLAASGDHVQDARHRQCDPSGGCCRVGDERSRSDAAAERLYYIAITPRCHMLGTSAVDPLAGGVTRSASDEEQGLTSCGPSAPVDSIATVAVGPVYAYTRYNNVVQSTISW